MIRQAPGSPMENPAAHPESADAPRPDVIPVHLGAHWHIDLDPGFRRRSDGGGDLVLWKGGRTVYTTLRQAGSAEAEEAIARMLDDRRQHVVRQFERIEPGLVGHAYLLPETSSAKKYWGLNTWLAAHRSVLCITFYFPDLADLPWALAAWQSVKSGESSEAKYAN
jgi:hypothetical protein